MILPLAACLGGEGMARMIPESETRDAPPRRIALFGGDVVAASPAGYCLDTGSVQTGRGGAFVLMADCAHLGQPQITAVAPAIVTVSVLARDGRAQQPSARRLAAAWDEAGVTRQIDGDGISLIQLARGGEDLMPGVDPGHWRAAMLVNGHVVALAAYGEPGSGVSGKVGHDLLVAASEAMREASPQRMALPPPSPRPVSAVTPAPGNPGQAVATDRAAPVKVARPEKSPGRGLKSMLSGLFRNPA
ncbi:hypothetical protein [Roseovarius nanhaiticus]|uniref:hypothetical protein n=1 Tax=Roseovarius nanhaiticus TaxID=573024 RepID=UPI00248F7F07|nr:hypothetical protein [Roseovarius nanhaiticus]